MLISVATQGTVFHLAATYFHQIDRVASRAASHLDKNCIQFPMLGSKAKKFFLVAICAGLSVKKKTYTFQGISIKIYTDNDAECAIVCLGGLKVLYKDVKYLNCLFSFHLIGFFPSTILIMLENIDYHYAMNSLLLAYLNHQLLYT